MIVSLMILCAIAATFAVGGLFLMLDDAESRATLHRTLCIPNPGPAILLCGRVAQPGRTLRQSSCLYFNEVAENSFASESVRVLLNPVKAKEGERPDRHWLPGFSAVGHK